MAPRSPRPIARLRRSSGSDCGRPSPTTASSATRRTWGDGYGYLLVATGRMDVMVDPTVQPYDIAAMPVIIGEAGGRFTALDGRAGFDHGSGVATNGVLHDAVLALFGTRS